MEEILSMREKSVQTLKELHRLIKEVAARDLENEELSQKCLARKAKLDGLIIEVDELKKNYKNEKQKLDNKEQQLEEYQANVQTLREDKKQIEKFIQQIEAKEKILKKTKRSLSDEQTLARGKQKLQLYKELTGIRWDYSTPDSILTGYITDKQDYLKKFSYTSDKDATEIQESLWNEMHNMAISKESKVDKD